MGKNIVPTPRILIVDMDDTMSIIHGGIITRSLGGCAEVLTSRHEPEEGRLSHLLCGFCPDLVIMAWDTTLGVPALAKIRGYLLGPPKKDGQVWVVGELPFDYLDEVDSIMTEGLDTPDFHTRINEWYLGWLVRTPRA